MRNFLVLILSLTFVMPTHAQITQTDLQRYIKDYNESPRKNPDGTPDTTRNGPLMLTPLAKAQELRARLVKDAERFKLFYEGPEDSGTDSVPKENWNDLNFQRQKAAQEFLEEQMDLPVEAINIFTLEMMNRYLKEPNSRPAIRQLIFAIQGMKFSTQMINDLEASRDWRTPMTYGVVAGGVVSLAAFCILRFGLCSRLALTQNLTDEARAAYRNAASKPRPVLRFGRVAPRAGETTIQKILRGINLSYSPAATGAAETVGGAIAKGAAFKRYYSLDFNNRLVQLGVVLVPSLAIGGGLTIVQKLYLAAKSGKYDFELLSPAELEQKYYGSLAILELTCKARTYVRPEPAKTAATPSGATPQTPPTTPKVSDDELAAFILDARQQVLLLGRMAGGIQAYDKVPLDFVTKGENGQSINVDIVTHRNHTESFTRPCPGASNLSNPVTTSLKELEGLLELLLSYVPEPQPVAQTPVAGVVATGAQVQKAKGNAPSASRPQRLRQVKLPNRIQGEAVTIVRP